jgi:hypothetical protein
LTRSVERVGEQPPGRRVERAAGAKQAALGQAREAGRPWYRDHALKRIVNTTANDAIPATPAATTSPGGLP